MKKIFALITVCLVIVLSGCSNKVTDTIQETDSSVAASSESIGGNPTQYSVDYKEYKEAQWNEFKIFVPYVSNLGNQELEKRINEVLKKEAVTWLAQDDIFFNSHQPQEPHIWCQSEQILSIELSYENLDGKSTTFVSQFITIDMQEGKKLSFQQLIKDENKLISLLQDGKSICSFGTIYDKNQSESDSYIRKTMKDMSEDDVKNILAQCKLSQEEFALYDEGSGEPTVYNRSDFFISEDVMVIVYVEHGYTYYIALEMETLKSEETQGVENSNNTQKNIEQNITNKWFDNTEKVDYKGDFTFPAEHSDTLDCKIKNLYIGESSKGILYQMLLDVPDIAQVPEELLNIGFFYFENDRIYRMLKLSQDEQSKLLANGEIPGSATVVCQDEEIKDKNNNKGWHERIDRNGDVVEYYRWNDENTTNFYEHIFWKENIGVILYRRGYAAERDAITMWRDEYVTKPHA